jgi:hypothetical protein
MPNFVQFAVKLVAYTKINKLNLYLRLYPDLLGT